MPQKLVHENKSIFPHEFIIAKIINAHYPQSEFKALIIKTG